MINTIMQDIEELKKVQDEYEKIQKDYNRVDVTNDTLRYQLEEASRTENELRNEIYDLKEKNKKLRQDLKKINPYHRRMLRSKNIC